MASFGDLLNLLGGNPQPQADPRFSLLPEGFGIMNPETSPFYQPPPADLSNVQWTSMNPPQKGLTGHLKDILFGMNFDMKQTEAPQLPPLPDMATPPLSPQALPGIALPQLPETSAAMVERPSVTRVPQAEGQRPFSIEDLASHIIQQMASTGRGQVPPWAETGNEPVISRIPGGGTALKTLGRPVKVLGKV